MPRPHLTLRISQPCHESWAAMTPTALGRHCAACQKTVVDFSQKTDAELLAYFQQPSLGSTCGRFYNDQLNRLLVPAAAPGTSRWRTWLALLLAAWGTERSEAAPAPLSHPTHHTPAKATPKRRASTLASTLASKYVQGVVRSSATGTPLAGVAVFLRGENRMATTDSAGRFRLRLSPRRPRGGRALVLHFAGYVSKTVQVPATTRDSHNLRLTLHADPAATGAEIVGNGVQRREVTGGAVVAIVATPAALPAKPAASPKRGLFQWFTKLFHKGSST